MENKPVSVNILSCKEHISLVASIWVIKAEKGIYWKVIMGLVKHPRRLENQGHIMNKIRETKQQI